MKSPDWLELIVDTVIKVALRPKLPAGNDTRGTDRSAGAVAISFNVERPVGIRPIGC
jgi:hypothetical protein